MKKTNWTLGGGFLGWLIGGPLGALIGGTLGYLFSPDTQEVKCPHCGEVLEVDPNDKFIWECANCGRVFAYDPIVSKEPMVNIDEYLTSVYFILWKWYLEAIAAIDGSVDNEEIGTYKELVMSVWKLPENQIPGFSTEVQTNEDINNLWTKVIFPRMSLFRKIDQNSPETGYIDLLIFSAYVIANSVPPIHPKQEKFIVDTMTSLGIAEDHIWEIKKEVIANMQAGNLSEDEISRAYEVLGIPLNSNCVRIKRAYYEKVSQLHPDKHSNVDDIVKQVLNEKVQEVNNAYAILKKHLKCK